MKKDRRSELKKKNTKWKSDFDWTLLESGNKTPGLEGYHSNIFIIQVCQEKKKNTADRVQTYVHGHIKTIIYTPSIKTTNKKRGINSESSYWIFRKQNSSGVSLVTKAAATFPIFVELKDKRQEMTTSPRSPESALKKNGRGSN